MSFRSTVVRWALPFPLGILLTPFAAFAGTLGTMALSGMSYCFLSPSSVSCTDFLAAGLLFGSMFAAPCTALLIPLLYILWGSRTRLWLFAAVCAVIGVVTMQGWESVSRFMNPRQLVLPGPDPFLAAAMVAAFVFAVAYFPIMRFIEGRLAPRLVAEERGAAA